MLKLSDRVSFPANFEFYAHENGFNIKHEGNYYSIILNSKLVLGGGRHTGYEVDKWELKDVDGAIQTFSDLREAANYVIRSEGYIPEVLDIENFYKLEVRSP